ncbi:hypothetical protein ACFX13_018687 [Malus domestica]
MNLCLVLVFVGACLVVLQWLIGHVGQQQVLETEWSLGGSGLVAGDQEVHKFHKTNLVQVLVVQAFLGLQWILGLAGL